MLYQISHTTTYHYDQPVKLDGHTVRLCPRSEGCQRLEDFAITLSPTPVKRSDILDMEGNTCLRLWFPDVETTTLKIHTQAHVTTTRMNPFDYLIEPWAIATPIDYPSSVAMHLAPYLTPALSSQFSPAIVEMAQGVLHEVEGNVSFFVLQLNQHIYNQCEYIDRPSGAPQSASLTWTQRSGSCRDFTILFMEACQAVGLAARFVSGYQEGDEQQESRELHAWPEVYIPGGGWRGFDPTHGLAVCDRHIALAAAAHPANAAPVSGILKPGYTAASTLSYDIAIRR